MAWFKIDDGLHSSRKVLSIPRSMRLECVGLWVMCGAWSSKELTDGHVPNFVLDEIGARSEAVSALCAAGLWLAEENGIRFHDWNEYNPTKEEILGKRKQVSEARSKAGKSGADSRWQKNGKRIAKKVLPLANADFANEDRESDVNTGLPENGKMANASQTDGKRIAPSQPNPTQSKETKVSLTKKSQIPSDWKPNDNHKEFASANGLNVDYEAAQFENHAHATGRTMKNWDAAFRVWLGNAVKWKPAQTVKKTNNDDWMNQ